MGYGHEDGTILLQVAGVDYGYENFCGVSQRVARQFQNTIPFPAAQQGLTLV
jgi:hypothetical protein